MKNFYIKNISFPILNRNQKVKNIKEILKYIPSKQADFTLYAIYENKNGNDYDKKIVKEKLFPVT